MYLIVKFLIKVLDHENLSSSKNTHNWKQDHKLRKFEIRKLEENWKDK